jgi:glyoxylase-like metal-dependent hydrolase (beta-lactamase superfamily II)
MKQITEGLWVWSWFSDEKGYNFNGTLVTVGKKKALIDPVMVQGAVRETLGTHAPFNAIYLTNKDHERAAYELRRQWGTPIFIHEADRGFLKEAPDGVFKDNEVLACGLQVLHLQHQKSPGESAFYLPEKNTLILGDALIGHPSGTLNLLPAAKYADVRRAQAGLRRLFSISFERLIVGDGEPFMENAQRALEDFFERL